MPGMGITPVEEVMSTLDALVRKGKVRYIGLSDTRRPGTWRVPRRWPRPPRMGEGLRAAAWSTRWWSGTSNASTSPPRSRLGMGVSLRGVRSPAASSPASTGAARRAARAKGASKPWLNSGNPALEKFTDRNWRILDTLLDVSRQLSRSPAQVAIAWATRRPGVASTLIGATKMSQLEDNLQALTLEIPPALAAKLEEVSRPELIFPYLFFAPTMRAMLNEWHDGAKGTAVDYRGKVEGFLLPVASTSKPHGVTTLSLHRKNPGGAGPRPKSMTPG